MRTPAAPQPPTTESAPVDRRSFARLLGVSAVGLGLAACTTTDADVDAPPSSDVETTPMAPTQTARTQADHTPESVLDMLREGNERFVAGQGLGRDYADQVRTTAAGQYPSAVVLGCIDSRVPVETVFDQGIGDVFAARVAGNVVNDDILGSMEFACNVAGSKAVVVLGHTACGAVKGAIGQARLGNLTGLVQKIEPAIEGVEGERNVDDATYVDAVAEENVMLALAQIRERSPVLAEMEARGDIAVVGAMYDVGTGAVRFL